MASVKQKLYCKKGYNRIYGEAHIPDDAKGPFPTVIYAHGLGNNMQPYPMERLVEQGVAVYCFDFCGGSFSSRSDGESIEMSAMTEVDDLNAVIDTLKKQDFVDEKNLFLCGMSQGGYVSTMLASQRPTEIRGLILLCPAYVIQYQFKDQFKRKEHIPAIFLFSNMTIGRRYVEDIWEIDIYNQMEKYPNDVLIFHGDADELVPLSFSERATVCFPAAELVVLHGESHMLTWRYEDNFFRMTMDYIKKHLKN
ncbi:alpha/beta hydrolase fold-1 [Trichococcus palustris]|uniref:Alpha/beta hydrolase fold-1 n=1 Tax=Trichococcus palustris TaxID=140314 RepID=A0A143YVL5_9LACT|nr:alpha/beta fold hydrolase [Trichococcus palustris]CZQ99405.1 alpha/beta hydrolase fold-1 [Trichococcus palustris]SFK87714.1 hypothetical protein SAMN04488076_10771 [Trichococcus palustris]